MTGEMTIDDPDSLLYVAIVGLVFNLVALALFHRAGHGHSRGGSGISRSPRSVRRSSSRRVTTKAVGGEY